MFWNGRELIELQKQIDRIHDHLNEMDEELIARETKTDTLKLVQ